MNKGVGLLFVVLGALVALFGPWIYNYIRILGYHKRAVSNLHPGTCKNIPGIEEGSEDMELLPNGKMLVTSGLEWPPFHPVNPGTRGRILLLDLNQPEPEPVELPIKGDLDMDTFHPLGITKWINKKIGKITILVVNVISTTQPTVVERFVYSEVENLLYHVETMGIGDPNFFIVDDIAATGERSFYYTNLHGQYAAWEGKYLLPWANIGYFNGKESKLVDENLASPNGIFFSPDRKYVYAAMCTGEYIRTYERTADYSLHQIQDFPVGMIVDNLHVDEGGDIWAAGHRVGWQVLGYMGDPTIPSPTQVTRLTMKEGKVTSSTNVFFDDGTLHSGGTVAVPYKNKLVIGSVLSKATICDMSSDSDQTDADE